MDLYLDHSRHSYAFTVEESFGTDAGRTFELGDRIKCGGNAVVHKCADSSTGVEYAVKFQLRSNSESVARFKKEQNLMRVLHHEHVVQFVGSGAVDANRRVRRKHLKSEIPFLVMELAEQSLFDRYKSSGWKIPYESYIAQFRGLSRALAELHKSAIHRDIKPHNILVKGETWLLSDYGLCCFLEENGPDLTQIDKPIGPRYWMSPEAVNRVIGRDSEITTASDVFQLAAVFWLIVNRRHPTGILSRKDWIGPENLFDPLFRALQHDPSRRPVTGATFAEEIAEAIAK